MPDLNVACQIKLPHNSAEGYGFHLRMLGNVNPDEGSHLGEKTSRMRGLMSTKQHSCETANFRHLHHQLEEAGEIEGEPHSGTRRE